MSSYAQLADLRSYAPQLASQQDAVLQPLLDLAERDLDQLVLPPTRLTAALQLLTPVGVAAGHFTLALAWLGHTYKTGPIAWNADGLEVVDALNVATNELGQLPPETNEWQLPPPTANNLVYPEGPFPTAPIAVRAGGGIAEQSLPLLVVDETALTGTITVTSVVAGGMKVDPTLLAPRQITALNRATCAQAEYRYDMGPQFFRRSQFSSVSGPVFNTQGKLPLIGPKVRRELTQSGLVMVGARASAGYSLRPTGVGVGWPPRYPYRGGGTW